MTPKIIAIDFDGTCVTHEFPRVGRDIGAAPVLRELVQAGHRLILYTMRSDKATVTSSNPNIHAVAGDYLSQAVAWFEHHGIPLWGCQTNPQQAGWTASPKCYAHLYIDDAALGIPLWYDEGYSERPFVNWSEVRRMLVQRGYLPADKHTAPTEAYRAMVRLKQLSRCALSPEAYRKEARQIVAEFVEKCPVGSPANP